MAIARGLRGGHQLPGIRIPDLVPVSRRLHRLRLALRGLPPVQYPGAPASRWPPPPSGLVGFLGALDLIDGSEYTWFVALGLPLALCIEVFGIGTVLAVVKARRKGLNIVSMILFGVTADLPIHRVPDATGSSAARSSCSGPPSWPSPWCPWGSSWCTSTSGSPRPHPLRKFFHV
ncbi:MAG: hypothetical protein MZV49_14085 [Rhodopseudomonas palustris]|nr:hypothetical protein [Rhodopseudomonas palustris]